MLNKEIRIDSHVHVITEKMFEDSIEILKSMESFAGIEWYNYLKEEGKLGVEGILKEMKKSKIDKAVILAMEYNINFPLLKISNDEIVEIVKKYPHKFIGFGSVCPTGLRYGKKFVDENTVNRCIKEVERCKRLGLKGIKFFQPFQHFYPSYKQLWPLYEKLEELGMPVIFHTGGEDYPGKVKYCHPEYIDDVAKNFPKLKIIIAHMGSYPFGVWFKDAMMMADENPNIFVDLAALRPRELIKEKLLEKALKWINHRKILFGSDYPVVFHYTMKQHKKVIEKELKRLVKQGIIEENAIKMIMGENLLNILGENDA